MTKEHNGKEWVVCDYCETPLAIRTDSGLEYPSEVTGVPSELLVRDDQIAGDVVARIESLSQAVQVVGKVKIFITCPNCVTTTLAYQEYV